MSSASFACQSDAFNSASKRDSSMCSGISSDESASELPHVSANCSAEAATDEEEDAEDDCNDNDEEGGGVAKMAPEWLIVRHE